VPRREDKAVNWDELERREFAYSRADFERAREMIRTRAGVALADHKHHLVYSRLSKRLRSLGKRSFAEYLDMLARDSEHAEWQHFTSALTTHLTSFFREPHHFELLAQFVAERRGKPLRIWCAAASTGEEPYSIAITVAEVLGRLNHGVSISATDIDTRALGTAEAGIYTHSRVENLSVDRLRKFFQRGVGGNKGKVRVRPELAQTIRFFPLNLQHAHWPLDGHFDAIFCRNVLIYFNRPDQERLIERLTRLLTPDGILFLGHSENAQCMGKRVTLAGKTAYRLNPSTQQLREHA